MPDPIALLKPTFTPDSKPLARLWQSTTLGVVIPTEFPDGVIKSAHLGVVARLAEEQGFSAVWSGDHLVWHCPVLESLSSLAYVAAVTERVVIGTSVLLAALRPPLLLAKMLATIDELSGGRLVVGIGVGGELPVEYEAAGVPLGQRGQRTDAMIDTLRALWTGAEVMTTPFWQIPHVMVTPSTALSGGPPVLVGGRSIAALRRAGRRGDGWIGLFVTPKRFRNYWSTVVQEAESANRDWAAMLPAVQIFTHLDDRADRAEGVATKWIGSQFGVDPMPMLRYCALGSSTAVAELIQSFIEAGARHVVLSPMGDPVEQQRRLAGVCQLLEAWRIIGRRPA